MPWLGLFQRVFRSECHVILDHVQSQRGKSLINRNKVLVGGEARWLGLPIWRSGAGIQKILDVQLSNAQQNLHKALETLRHSYHSAPHYAVSSSLFSLSYIDQGQTIAALNENFLRNVLEYLSCETKLVRSSDLIKDNPELETLSGNALIVGIAKAVGAKQYLSGLGCLDFIRPDVFEAKGVEFAFFNHEQPDYPQLGEEFKANLSIFDHLSMLDHSSLREIMSRGYLVKASELPKLGAHA